MTAANVDHRSAERRVQDEQIAAEPPMAAPDLPPGAVASPVEAHLEQFQKHPRAIIGVVENGLVRPLDPAVTLPEKSRVIIVAPEAA